MIDRESARGTWLHGRLSSVAEQCVGIDINEGGIDYLKRILKIEDVFCCDLTREDIPLVLDQPFDYLLLGEMLEHIDNPVSFKAWKRRRLQSRHPFFHDTVVVTASLER